MSIETLRPLGIGPPVAARDAIKLPKSPETSEVLTLVSVVVPTFGQLEMTRLCLPRVLRFGRSPFEVVVVDGGSLDGTAEYLAGLADSGIAPVQVVRSEDDLDLATACTLGIGRAGGGVVVLLANDCLVPEGWLNQMTALLRIAPDIGMVGVMTNLAPPPQWVGKLPYRLGPGQAGGLDVGPVDAFARQWREQHRGQSLILDRLGGPCLLFRAEVLKKMDLTRCLTPFAAFDGDLLGRQVRQAGYRLVCCEDLFVHHLGSRPFVALRVQDS
jgi:GT2 family glycosyltransferase